MQMVDYNTQLFKNIFPDYDTFKNWYLNCGLSDNETDVPAKKTFTLIANEYNDSHTSLSVEGFKEHFANDIYTYYKEFEETTKNILELMKLTEDDIAIADSMITNFASVPETTSSTDTESVDYITNQQKTLNKKGKLTIQKELLSSKRTFTTRTFINRFRHLFIKIISPYYNFVVSEPDNQ